MKMFFIFFKISRSYHLFVFYGGILNIMLKECIGVFIKNTLTHSFHVNWGNIKMKKNICFLIIILTVEFFSCGSNKPIDIPLNQVINEVNNSRISSEQPQDIEKYLYHYDSKDEGFSDAEIAILSDFDYAEAEKNYNGEKTVTKEQAIKDINYLFRLLKYSYGGYQYFGGDKVFGEAKINVIKSINSCDNITPDYLLRILYQYLDFIKDGHFALHSESLIARYFKVYYYNDDYEFFKDKKGYFTLIDNKSYYLKSVDGSDNVQDYIKLSINRDGRIIYTIGLLQNINTPKNSLTLTFVRNKNKLDKQITLEKSERLKDTATGFNKDFINDVPVVKCRRMADIDKNDNTTELFSGSGSELKLYPISIVDIRGNGGGSDTPCDNWFIGYTGKKPTSTYSQATLLSKINCTINKNIMKQHLDNDNMSEDNYKTVLNYYEYYNTLLKSKNFNQWNKSKETAILAENKNIVFVLLDKSIASSGETFVKYLRNLKNVVFVGTNTKGCDLFGNCVLYKLPNTGLMLYFGTSLHLTEGLEEGTGFLPDIWVGSNDSLERVLKLIANYKNQK